MEDSIAPALRCLRAIAVDSELQNHYDDSSTISSRGVLVRKLGSVCSLQPRERIVSQWNQWHRPTFLHCTLNQLLLSKRFSQSCLILVTAESLSKLGCRTRRQSALD